MNQFVNHHPWITSVLFPVFGYYQYNCCEHACTVFRCEHEFSFSISFFQLIFPRLPVRLNISSHICRLFQIPVLRTYFADFFSIGFLPLSYWIEWVLYMFWISILCQFYEIVYVDILVSTVSQSDVKFRNW